MTPINPDDPSPLPRDWDLLGSSRPSDEAAGNDVGGRDDRHSPATVSLLFSGIADLVVILAGCAGALAVARGQGLPVTVWALPWGAAAGAVIWCAMAAATVSVRRGTPGMVMMGLAVRDPVTAGRLPQLLVVGLLAAVTLGLPTLLLGRWSRICESVAGSPLELVD